MNILKLETADQNNNSESIVKLLEGLSLLQKEVAWVVCDLNFVPKLHREYHSSGKNELVELAYNFKLKLDNSKYAMVSFMELQEILLDTSCIRRGVFICLPENLQLDDFYADVEPENINIMQHNLALHEVRVLDDLIFILSK